MTVDLCFCEGAKRYEVNAIAARILDRLAHQSFAYLAATQRSRHIRVIDDDQTFAGSAISHFRLNAINDDAVTPFHRTIFPLDLFLGDRRNMVRHSRVGSTYLTRLPVRALQKIACWFPQR